MDSNNSTLIQVQTKVKGTIESVWKYWTTPHDITQWYVATDAWHTPRAENDVMNGGKFLFRMEAKDGSFGFDFSGVYASIEIYKSIAILLDDGRSVSITFEENDNEVVVTETFEAEKTNPIEMQQRGWQAIVDNFKKYVEQTR